MINNNEIELLIQPDYVINYAPQSLEQEISQNIITILTTSKYSVPLDREFGLNMQLVDMPQTTVKALISNEIVEAIEKYEPRVKVTQVRFTGDIDGVTQPVIRFKIMS